MSLSIIIPVFNEKKNLIKLIREIKKKIKLKEYEIIIIDDSSNDGSICILKNILLKYSKVKVIFRKKSRDLSKSCIDGFKKSIYPNILVMDGDLQHDPKYIHQLYFKYLNGNYDFVVGARKLFNKRVLSLKLYRQILSITIIIIFNIFFGKKTNDPMSGFFIFKKKIYENNKKKLYGLGFKILADLIYLNKKFKTADLSINFRNRKKHSSKLNFKIIFILIKFIFFNIRRKYFLSK